MNWLKENPWIKFYETNEEKTQIKSGTEELIKIIALIVINFQMGGKKNVEVSKVRPYI